MILGDLVRNAVSEALWKEHQRFRWTLCFLLRFVVLGPHIVTSNERTGGTISHVKRSGIIEQ